MTHTAEPILQAKGLASRERHLLAGWQGLGKKKDRLHSTRSDAPMGMGWGV